MFKVERTVIKHVCSIQNSPEVARAMEVEDYSAGEEGEVEEGEIGANVVVREDALHIIKCGSLSSADVMGLFPDQDIIQKVEWVTDDSCNVVFDSLDAVAMALNKVAKLDDGTMPSILKQNFHWWIIKCPSAGVEVYARQALVSDKAGADGGVPDAGARAASAHTRARSSQGASSSRGLRVQSGARVPKHHRSHPTTAAKRQAVLGTLAGLEDGFEDGELDFLDAMTTDEAAHVAQMERGGAPDPRRLGRALPVYGDLGEGATRRRGKPMGAYMDRTRKREPLRLGAPPEESDPERRRADLRSLVLSNKPLGAARPASPEVVRIEVDDDEEGQIVEEKKPLEPLRLAPWHGPRPEAKAPDANANVARGRGAATFRGAPSHILGFERRDVSVTPVPEIIRAEPLAPPRDREPEERRSEDQRREPRRLDVRVGGAAREDRERGSRRAPPRSALRTHDDGVKKRGRGFSQGGVGAMIAFGTRA